MSTTILFIFVYQYNPKSHLNLEKSDLVVILGAGYLTNGTPVPALERRLTKGYDIWNQIRKIKKSDVFIMLSGQTREVSVMHDYLEEEHDINSDFIILDNKGKNTRATVLNASQIQKQLKTTSIFVSQAYHLPRIKLYAWYYNIDAQYAASERLEVKFIDMFEPVCREVFAIIFFFPSELFRKIFLNNS